jgi:hypothetical protein
MGLSFGNPIFFSYLCIVTLKQRIMKVISTWVFTYEQFKDIPVLVDVITQKRINERTGGVEISVYLTTNGWPNFHMVTVYKVIEDGVEEYYIHRPYHLSSSGRGSTTYHDILLKVPHERKEELEKVLE